QSPPPDRHRKIGCSAVGVDQRRAAVALLVFRGRLLGSGGAARKRRRETVGRRLLVSVGFGGAGAFAAARTPVAAALGVPVGGASGIALGCLGVERHLGRHALDLRLRPRSEFGGGLGLLRPRIVAVAVALAGIALARIGLIDIALRGAALLGDITDAFELVALVVEIVVRRVALVLHVLDRHLRLGGRDDAVIVLGVLQVVLGHHAVAGALRVACKLRVFFRNLLRGAADLHIRTVALIVARQGVRPLARS